LFVEARDAVLGVLEQKTLADLKWRRVPRRRLEVRSYAEKKVLCGWF
jgi:hypothetical protein